MTHITIREQGTEWDGHAVSIDEIEYPIAELDDPFNDEEEERLAWYFEEHLEFPITDQVEARRAAESVEEYGHRLFEQVFDNNDACAEYDDEYRVVTRRASIALWQESGNDALIGRVSEVRSIRPDEVKIHFDATFHD